MAVIHFHGDQVFYQMANVVLSLLFILFMLYLTIYDVVETWKKSYKR